jgi:biotin transporter BioY
MLVLYAGGVAQLALVTGSLAQAAGAGLLPFVALDLVKAHVAALLAPRRRD